MSARTDRVTSQRRLSVDNEVQRHKSILDDIAAMEYDIL